MKCIQKEQIAQITQYDPWSAGINLRSTQSDLTPRILTLNPELATGVLFGLTFVFSLTFCLYCLLALIRDYCWKKICKSDFDDIQNSNVYKSGTLSSAARECHSLNWERSRSATPFYQKERCGSGTRIFEESENMSDPLFTLFFLTFFLLFPFFF